MVELIKLRPAKVTGPLTKVLLLCPVCDIDRVWCSSTGKVLQVPRRMLKSAKFKCSKCGSPDVKVIYGKALLKRSQKYWGTPSMNDRYARRRGRPFKSQKVREAASS